MFIVYKDGNEVLVTTTKREEEMLKEWFAVGMGRLVDDYERQELNCTAVGISNSILRVDY